MEMMLMFPHEFDVALCDVTVNNAVLSFSLVGQPCSRGFLQSPLHIQT